MEAHAWFEGFDPRSDRDDTKHTNAKETERVHDLYRREIAACMATNGTTELDERKAFCRDWVDLVESTQAGRHGNLKMPGEPARPRAHTSEATPRQRHEDAANLQLRWLMMDNPRPDWALLGIECTICQRHGLAFPGGYYNAQQSLL